MNKVLEECAEKAGWVYVGTSRIPNMKKFGELIIQECVNICKANAKEYSDKNRGIWHDPTENLVSNKLAHKIMEHFGD